MEVCCKLLPVCLPPHLSKCPHVSESTAAPLCCAVTVCWCFSVAAWWACHLIPAEGTGVLTVYEYDNVLPVSSLLRQFLRSSDDGLELISTIRAFFAGWEGEGGRGIVRIPNVGSSSTIPYSVLGRYISEDMGPGICGASFLDRVQSEGFPRS